MGIQRYIYLALAVGLLTIFLALSTLGDDTSIGTTDTCGDRICQLNESDGSCDKDCGKGEYTCEIDYPGKTIPCEAIKAGECVPDMLPCKEDWQQSNFLYCGDGVCSLDENPDSCFADCGPNIYTCLDEPDPKPVFCEAIKESICVPDGIACKGGWQIANACGDGFCGKGEDSSNCPQDCPVLPACGDGICTEDFKTCPQDCLFCGDGMCTNGENATICEKDCPKIVESEKIKIVTAPAARWIEVYDDQDMDIEETAKELCISSPTAVSADLRVYDYKGVPLAELAPSDDKYCYNKTLLEDKAYIKFGDHSTIIVYQNESYVSYTDGDLQVNATLERWNGGEFVVSPDDIWIDANNSMGLKFGGNDVFATQTTRYRYVWDSNVPISYDGRYYMGGEVLTMMYSSIYEKRYIDAQDVCVWENSSCEWVLSNDSKQLNLTFYAPYNETLGMVRIDPAYVLGWTSVSGLPTNDARIDGPFAHLTLSTATEPMDNLVAYYPFDSDSVTTSYDLSSYDNDGTYTNGAYPTSSGKYDDAAYFDGTNDYINIPDATSFSFTDGSDNDRPYSLSAWLYMKEDTLLPLICKASSAYEWCLQIITDGKLVISNYGANNAAYHISRTSNSTMSTYNSKWIHVVATYDGSESYNGFKLYINNSEIASTGSQGVTYGGGMDNTAAPVTIGYGMGQYANANFDEVQIFNKTLNTTEINDIFNAQSPRFKTNGTVSYPPVAITPGYNTANVSVVGEMYNGSNISVAIASWNLSSGYNNTDFSGYNGLVSVWHADGNASDSKGSNSGTLYGDTTYTSGVYNRSFSFDGTGDYIRINNTDDELDFTNGQLTLSTWVYLNSLGVTHELIFKHDAYAPGNGYGFEIARIGSTDVLQAYSNGGGTQSRGTTVFSTGRWYHVVAKKSGSGQQWRLFVNGVEETYSSTDTTQPLDSEVDVLIGGNNGLSGWGNRYLNGRMDEVMIFNRSLSADEVKELYAKGRAKWDVSSFKTTDTQPTVNESEDAMEGLSGLVSYWQANNNATDSVGSNHGTLYGDTTYATGKLNNAFSLDGAGDYIQVPDAAAFSFVSGVTDKPYSISLWYYPTSATATGGIVCKDGSNTDTNREWCLYASNGYLYIFNVDDGASLAYIGRYRNTALPPNIWYHVTATYDGTAANSGFKIYLNTIAWDTVNYGSGTYSSMEDTTQPIWVGRLSSSYTAARMDEVMIFNRTLSAVEIMEIYGRGAGKYYDINAISISNTSTTIRAISQLNASSDNWYTPYSVITSISTYTSSCTPSWTNTSWSAWSDNSTCYINNTKYQVRDRTQYDANSCPGSTNTTFYDYQWTGCDYYNGTLSSYSITLPATAYRTGQFTADWAINATDPINLTATITHPCTLFSGSTTYTNETFTGSYTASPVFTCDSEGPKIFTLTLSWSNATSNYTTTTTDIITILPYTTITGGGGSGTGTITPAINTTTTQYTSISPPPSESVQWLILLGLGILLLFIISDNNKKKGGQQPPRRIA